MNKGTAEQEQNGVTMPSEAAKTFPTDSRRPAKTRRVRSGVKNDLIMPTAKTTNVSNIKTFGVSNKKNDTADPNLVPWERESNRYVNQSAKGASCR